MLIIKHNITNTINDDQMLNSYDRTFATDNIFSEYHLVKLSDYNNKVRRVCMRYKKKN